MLRTLPPFFAIVCSTDAHTSIFPYLHDDGEMFCCFHLRSAARDYSLRAFVLPSHWKARCPMCPSSDSYRKICICCWWQVVFVFVAHIYSLLLRDATPFGDDIWSVHIWKVFGRNLVSYCGIGACIWDFFSPFKFFDFSGACLGSVLFSDQVIATCTSYIFHSFGCFCWKIIIGADLAIYQCRSKV